MLMSTSLSISLLQQEQLHKLWDARLAAVPGTSRVRGSAPLQRQGAPAPPPRAPRTRLQRALLAGLLRRAARLQSQAQSVSSASLP